MIGSIDGTEYSFTDSPVLDIAKHYYWRIEQISGNFTQTGEVWDFYTIIPGDYDGDSTVILEDLTYLLDNWLAESNHGIYSDMTDFGLLAEYWHYQ